MLIRAYFDDRGEGEQRTQGRHPRHGARHEPGQRDDGRLRADAGRARTRAATSTSTTCAAKVDEHTAGLMLTNPSTLGLFDENIEEIRDIFHGAGALMYYDGANLNAVCGISRPGDMGFDIVHINLHKTFSQPHGGGGPGGGPIAVREQPRAVPARAGASARDGDAFRLDYDRPKSIGKVRGFTGPFGVFVRSYAFMRVVGAGRCAR